MPATSSAVLRSHSICTMTDEPSRTRLIDNPYFVLALLFGVTGVLGVPVLVRSRAFSPTNKLLLAVAVTLYTMALIALVGWILYWAWSRISAAL